VVLTLLFLGCASLAGCNYTSKPPFRTDIHTVGLRPIDNRELGYPGVEFDLTEALKKTIEAHSPYKVTSVEGADTILQCTITTIRQSTLVYSVNGGVPQELEMRIAVDYQWTNVRTGQVLADAKGLAAVGRYVPTLPIAETASVGQHQAVQLLADKMVSAMRSGW
jgi:hypothetical protein